MRSHPTPVLAVLFPTEGYIIIQLFNPTQMILTPLSEKKDTWAVLMFRLALPQHNWRLHY